MAMVFRFILLSLLNCMYYDLKVGVSNLSDINLN